MIETVEAERRAHRRISLEDPIKVRVLTPGPLLDDVTTFSIGEGYLYDVTLAGAFVATDMVVDKGQTVELEIDVPGADGPQYLPAVVARRAGPTRNHTGDVPAGLGFAFAAATPQDFKLINEIVVTTLTLDLLEYGYERKQSPSTKKPASNTHPIPWPMPGPGYADNTQGVDSTDRSTESTTRIHVSDLLRETNSGDTDFFAAH